MTMPRSTKGEREVARELEQFETENRAFELLVHGVSPWRLVRFPVGLAMQNITLDRPRLMRREYLVAFLRSLWDLCCFPRHVRYIVKSYSSALRLPKNGAHEDIYFERLLESVPGGVRMYFLNAPGYAERTTEAVASSVDATAINIIGSVLARLFPVRSGSAVFDRLGALIESRLRVRGFPSRQLRRMFSSFWWQSRIYGFLLARSGARTVLVADAGERALLSACRQQGIRFIELQHGIFNPDDFDSLPRSALNDVGVAALLLPDAVALYGDFWLDRLAGTALGKVGRLFPVGSSVIERFRDLRAETFRQTAACPRLVVTTQGFERTSLAEFLARFLEAFLGPCLLILKLHPVFDDSVAPYAKILGSDERVRILRGCDDPNTYELIAQADLHMSIASACHYDALGIGTPTLVLGLTGYSFVQDLIDTGDVLFARDPEALAAIVSRHGWTPVDESVSVKYYRRGFVQNLLPLIA